tara:strand:+ start:3419 stop:3994 length:576 start_codon:yes stop_codon:yes gene_type:complete
MSLLREIRHRKDLSQRELADKMQTTTATISRYENQDQRLTLPLLRKFSQVLNVSIAEIVGELNQPTIHTIPLINPTEGKKNVYLDSEIPCCDLKMGDDYFGFIVEGDTMFPTFKEGDIVIFHKSMTDDKADGILIFEVKTGDTFIARSQYNPIDDVTTLTTDNPNYQNYGEITSDKKIKILGRICCSITQA